MPHSNIFGPPGQWPAQDFIALSATADSAVVLEAYRSGVFPMPIPHAQWGNGIAWWSPMRRGILPLDSFRVTRSMRRSARRYVTTVDRRFDDVLDGCADPSRPNGWIDDTIKQLFTDLNRKGFVHSVETWDDEGRLVGGLYGVSIGGLFAGESMFHHPDLGPDASKVALMTLVDVLSDEHASVRVIDTQWLTPHLASLGAFEIDRDEYLTLLDELLDVPDAGWGWDDMMTMLSAARSRTPVGAAV